MTLVDAIRQAMEQHEGEPPEDVARALFGVANPTEKREWLLLLLAREIEIRQRNHSREKERRAFETVLHPGGIPLPQALAQIPAPSGPTNALRLLLKTPFKVSGQWVAWGSATADEHRERVKWLEHLRTGLDRTIEQHKAAIRAIEESGVQCLDDLTDDALPVELAQPALAETA